MNRVRTFLISQLSGEGLRAQLIRAALGSAGIQAANRILSLALGILLARALGAEGYGIYAYAFAIMSLLMVVAEAGVPTLLMRELAASQAKSEWGLLRGVLRRAGQFVTLAACVVALIAMVVLWSVSDKLSSPTLYTTALMLLVLPLSAGAKTVAHALRGLHRVVLAQAVDMLLRPILVLILAGVAFWLSPEFRQPQYAMVAQLLGASIVLIAGLLILWQLMPDKVRTTPPTYRSHEWLRSALPFTLIGGALIVSQQTDIIMMGWFVTSDEVGLYRVAVQGGMLVAFALQVMNAIFSPRFAEFYAKGESRHLQRMITLSGRAILCLSFPVVLVFIAWGDQLATLVFGPQFAASHTALAILATGQFISGGFGCIGVLMSMTGREKLLARGLWGCSLLNVILNLFLVPLYSGTGAAIATAVSWLFLHFILYISVKKDLGVRCQPFLKI